MTESEIPPKLRAAIRAQAMNELRDIFQRDGEEMAAIVCSNLSALTQVEAGLSTIDEIRERGTTDLPEISR